MTEIITNNMSELTESEDSNGNVLMEIAELLESCMASRDPTINDEDAQLIYNHFPGMVEDNNQPLPENIPKNGRTTGFCSPKVNRNLAIMRFLGLVVVMSVD